MQKRHIPIADLRISKRAKTYIGRVLATNRLSYGPYTQVFEKQFGKLHKRKYSIVTNSGTSGLQVALHAMKELYDWSDGDEVLVPAITFIATSNVVLHNNLKPVFVDVEPDYYSIDPAKIEAMITPRTRAIMPVHLFGQSADMKLILTLAKKYKLKVLEDSCETMFVKYEGRPVGSLGDVSVYSTYIAHVLTTGVGGMVTTNNKRLATMIKSLMFHGRDNIYLTIDDDDTSNRSKLRDLIERRFKFIHVGYSYRNTELEGALGLAEIENKDWIVANRKRVGRAITNVLTKYDQFFQLPAERETGEHIYMLYPIVIRDKRIRLNKLLMYLESHNIETRLFFPLLTQPIYKKLFGNIEKNYPIARHLVQNGFIIGCTPYLTSEDTQYIGRTIGDFLKHEKLLA